MRRSQLSRWLVAAGVAAGAVGAGSCQYLRLGPDKDKAADTLFVNGDIVTMDADAHGADCLATKGSVITCVSSGPRCCSQVKGANTVVVDLQGATVLPGFIDTHSHMAGFGLLDDPDHWIDVSSVNVFLKPLPGDPRCPAADDYQRCFIPVKNQDEVVDRLKRGLPSTNDPAFAPILGLNYDPARLGHAKSCKGTGVGFACQNLEDGTAKAQLDKISNIRPVLIGSESGHITYVNGKMLDTLRICEPGGGKGKPDAAQCRAAVINREVEEKLAKTGQLDEDLSFAAVDAAINDALGKDPLKGMEAAIRRAAAKYAGNGFTTVQEGTTAPAMVAAYALVTGDAGFPVTVRALLYDPATREVEPMAKKVKELQKLETQSFKIVGLKAFADGSTQGYTGSLGSPYLHVWPPFNTPSIFHAQPYKGLPDVEKVGLAEDFVTAHGVGLPLMVHQNGDAAIADVLGALPPPPEKGGKPPPRDVMIHFAMASAKDLETAKARGLGVTFLTPDLYYYGQPMCQQVLGPERTARLYPAGEAAKMGVRFGLHSDTPVTPPSPLFMIWVARTRKTQMMPWYEKNPACPEVMGPEQAISILQGVKAFTSDAAWMYGLESSLGSIEEGKTADLVQLSANPLSMETDPDQLKTVRVLATVHNGKYLPNPDAKLPPIWPE